MRTFLITWFLSCPAQQLAGIVATELVDKSDVGTEHLERQGQVREDVPGTEAAFCTWEAAEN
jgi:hypothetical protein